MLSSLTLKITPSLEIKQETKRDLTLEDVLEVYKAFEGENIPKAIHIFGLPLLFDNLARYVQATEVEEDPMVGLPIFSNPHPNTVYGKCVLVENTKGELYEIYISEEE
jgi:hypothetical protein